MKLIVNQDRNRICRYKGVHLFRAYKVLFQNICMGYNLMYQNCLLGTFEDLDECGEEVVKITLSRDLVYFMPKN